MRRVGAWGAAVLLNLGVGYLAVYPLTLVAVAVVAPGETAEMGGMLAFLPLVAIALAVVGGVFYGVNRAVVTVGQIGGRGYWRTALVLFLVPSAFAVGWWDLWREIAF
ncbi:hypothetical protein JOD54_006334 [Actinokineospora baliensis]|uniref:hypothetical protein n=1 Tax=Actinokineospora baliensis TaxID=547056 RepID=UPI00195BE6A6|nr:hypothetical protein [Actinokineospora baliensis]MBM7776130.1 hypothetical protein [Actinokineospora baliensis]